MILSAFFNNDKLRLRLWMIRGGAVLLSAALSACVLPGNGLPGWMAWITLVPLLLALNGTSWITGGFLGWLWGGVYGWGGFYWLAEIHPAAGIGIGPVFGAYWFIFGAAVSFLWKYIIKSRAERAAGWHGREFFCTPRSWQRIICFTVFTASFFTFTEFLRWHILPWNAFGVSQWDIPLVRGLAAQTGVPGISFALAAFNAALSVELSEFVRLDRKYRVSAAVWIGGIVLAATVSSSLPVLFKSVPENAETAAIGVIQPDLPRRTLDLSREEILARDIAAIDFNTEATAEIIHRNPSIILWPETSVSTPFRSSGATGDYYRRRILEVLRDHPDTELIIGSVEWENTVSGSSEIPGLTNSALVMSFSPAHAGVMITARYDKQHLVPFGEYVPFRKWLPEWLTENLSMGTDLAPGRDFRPVKTKNLNIGMNICFEDIFDYISRDFARNGADILAVITNDSWYPGGKEQYQHLANSVFRSIETGLPMIRCGSNSGTVIIHQDGHIESLPGLDPFRQMAAAGIFQVTAGASPGVRLYLVMGNWWQLVCTVLAAAALTAVFCIWRKDRMILLEEIKKTDGGKK